MQTVYEFEGFTLLWEQAKGIARGPMTGIMAWRFIGNWVRWWLTGSNWEVFPEVERRKIPGRYDSNPFCSGE
jgi:quinol-cytochrome oxidoreductase complex cytochrome b subunit